MADPADPIELAPGRSLPASAISWSFARSSGPGGQNVNKLNTKAILRVALADLHPLLGPSAMSRLAQQAARFIIDDQIVITCDEHRSQRDNRLTAIERLGELVRKALIRPKPRRKTRPTAASKERRIKGKKELGEKKRQRRDRFD